MKPHNNISTVSQVHIINTVLYLHILRFALTAHSPSTRSFNPLQFHQKIHRFFFNPRPQFTQSFIKTNPYRKFEIAFIVTLADNTETTQDIITISFYNKKVC